MDKEAFLDALEALRARQNKRHMGWLRIAFKHAPQEAAALEEEILREDEEITQLCKKLVKIARCE